MVTHSDSTPDNTARQHDDDPEALLLVSGSGLCPWIWDAFVRELPAGTAVAVAPRPSRKDAPLESYVEHAIDAAPAERFTIVGHSVGAIVGLAAAAAAPERVDGFVAVAGVVPQAPGSFLSAMPLPNRWILNVAMRIGGTRPPDKAIRSFLGAGLDPSVIGRLVDEFTPDSPHIFRSRIDGTDQPEYRGYLTTTADAEMPVKLQQRFSDALAPSWTTTMNTGHLPMLQDPAGMAAAIVSFTESRRNSSPNPA